MKLVACVLAVLVSACLPATTYSPGAPYATAAAPMATPTAVGTGLYINGQELTADERAQLEQLVGERIPAGRYALDAQGNFGYEGQAPVVNLAAYIRARQQAPKDEPFSMYSTDSAGRGSSLVSDGDCMIMSTPDATLSSGC